MLIKTRTASENIAKKIHLSTAVHSSTEIQSSKFDIFMRFESINFNGKWLGNDVFTFRKSECSTQTNEAMLLFRTLNEE